MLQKRTIPEGAGKMLYTQNVVALLLEKLCFPRLGRAFGKTIVGLPIWEGLTQLSLAYHHALIDPVTPLVVTTLTPIHQVGRTSRKSALIEVELCGLSEKRNPTWFV